MKKILLFLTILAMTVPVFGDITDEKYDSFRILTRQVIDNNFPFISDVTVDANEINTLDGAAAAMVTVTGPNILTLYSSPKELAAAPGAGNVIEFGGATIFYDYSGAAYGGEDVNVMSIRYKSDGSGNAASSTLAGTGFLTATGDTAARLIPVAIAATASADIENQPLVLYMAAADPNDGTGSAAAGVLRIKITYKILPSGF